MNRKTAGRLLAQKGISKKTKSDAGAVLGESRSREKVQAARENLKKARSAN